MEIHTSPRRAPCPRGQPLRSMEHHREVAGEAPIVRDPGGQLGRGQQWSWAATAVDSGTGAGSRTPAARVRVPPPSPRREDESERQSEREEEKGLRDGATGAAQGSFIFGRGQNRPYRKENSAHTIASGPKQLKDVKK